jgi:hypothetical protein
MLRHALKALFHRLSVLLNALVATGAFGSPAAL